MFLIKLDEKYSIRTDRYNYILVKKSDENKKKKTKRKEIGEDRTYYNNMGYLLRCYFEDKVKTEENNFALAEISSLEGYYANVTAFLEEINSRISPALTESLHGLYSDEDIMARK